MNNIKYATTFRNEQAAGQNPKRVTPEVDGDITVNPNVNSSGYEVNLNVREDGKWKLPFPEVEITQPYIKRNVKINVVSLSSGLGLNLSIFGLAISNGYFPNSLPLLANIEYRVSVVTDTSTNISYAYVNSRYVGEVQGTGYLEVTANEDWSTARQITLGITDVMILESNDNLPVQVNFEDLELEEVYNEDWTYSGESLVESLDKVDVTLTNPYIKTHAGGAEVQVTGNAHKPQLVEAAGRAGELGIRVTVRASSEDVQELENIELSQGSLKGVILSPGPIVVRREVKE